jgi:hypothetical protein
MRIFFTQLENENSIFSTKKPVNFSRAFFFSVCWISTRILSGFLQVFRGDSGVFLRAFHRYALAPG